MAAMPGGPRASISNSRSKLSKVATPLLESHLRQSWWKPPEVDFGSVSSDSMDSVRLIKEQPDGPLEMSGNLIGTLAS